MKILIQLTKNTNRKTGIELLRILCIFGIISMHQFGNFMGDATGFEIIYGVFECSLFNCGVSIFALISGYFGIRGGVKRIIKFELEILFWSVLSFILKSYIYGTFSLGMLVEAVTPVFSRKYWYMTEYMLLMLFAGYINEFCEKLKKEQFQKILMIFLFIGCIIPTFIQRDLSGYDGKCFLNLLFMYLIGRYINRFLNINAIKINKLIKAFIAIFIITIVFNLSGTTAYNLLKKTCGVHNPFGKDNSVFIVILSTVLFILFCKVKMHSKLINSIAKYVLPVYLFENAVGLFIKSYIYDPATFRGQGISFYVVLLIYPFIVYAICAIVAFIKDILFWKIKNWLTDLGFRLILRLSNQCIKTFNTLLNI